MSSDRPEIQGHLRLDRVLSSQPELGPSVPDGGYAWLIFICSLLIQLLIPSILSTYGILILFWVEETSVGQEVVYLTVRRAGGLGLAAVVHATSWAMAGPACRLLVTVSRWPRLAATAGVCTVGAGLLACWLTLAHNATAVVYLPGAIATGVGVCLTLSQSDSLIGQYFNNKLPLVRTLLWCSRAMGFFLTPLLVGLMIRSNGILHSLLVYQTVLLQLIMCVLLFKKPNYLKAKRRNYELIQNSHDDEEMVYPSNETELTTTSSVNLTNGASSQSSTQTITQSNQEQTTHPVNLLKDSFSQEYTEEFSPKNVHTPAPIYEETTQINDNIVSDVQDINLQSRQYGISWKQMLHFLVEGPFYRSFLVKMTACYSALVLWAFFPTYLYFNRADLHLKRTCLLSGTIAMGAFLMSVFSQFLPSYGERRKNALAAFCFTGAIGFFLVSDGISVLRGTAVIGGCLASLSITALQVGLPSSKRPPTTNRSLHSDVVLNAMVAISLTIILLLEDITFKNCFRLASLLNLILGSVFCSSVLYKRIKDIMVRQHS